MNTVEHGCINFTGVRPTGKLTVANAAGAIMPLIKSQDGGGVNPGERPLAFVADIHALTDQDPTTVRLNRVSTVMACIALGMNPEQSDLFVQSQIGDRIMRLNYALSRLTSLNQAVRVPTLKDKVDDPAQANLALLQYPTLMAADIILQRPVLVPTGKDQVAHVEFTRDLIDRINAQAGSGSVLPKPSTLLEETPNYLALKGTGKMSKSKPETALLLDEDIEVTQRKIRKAQTSVAGEPSDHMESMINLVEGIGDADSAQELRETYQEHSEDPSSKVAGAFKGIASRAIVGFCQSYQARRDRLNEEKGSVAEMLKRSAQRAATNADETLALIDSVSIEPFVLADIYEK